MPSDGYLLWVIQLKTYNITAELFLLKMQM